MSEILLLDYAWQVPSPAAIVAAGYQGVMRYLSPDVSKNLSAGERDALHKAGLSIGLVWEGAATRAGQGHAAGVADATQAEAQATALGFPAPCPIFFAVDYDTTPAAVAPYFAGVVSVATGAVGVYGSARVIEGTAVAYKWQSCAWSAGAVSRQAHLYQRLAATISHPLPGTDENVVLSPFPLWTNKPAAQPAPKPAPPINVQEDDMYMFIAYGAGQHWIVMGGHAHVIASSVDELAYKDAGVPVIVLSSGELANYGVK